MNIKQESFCRYYVGECHGNGSEAAIKAGYSSDCCRQTAYKLLQKTEIKAYISELRKQIMGDGIATIEEIQAFWTSIIRDEDEQMKNKIRASELLAKAIGVYDNEW